MERERWLQIKQIVNACLDMEPDRRESHISRTCDGDSVLATEVRSLLSSHEGLGDFLATSVLEDRDGGLPSGSRVGAYEIREAIGEGGMGTVYRAVRTTDFQRHVALKVVKRGMDTNSILQRFRHERQILAALDHPNIARLLDGGATVEGRPYLVMEYIEGRLITDYCEERALSVPQRLQLFRAVCSAVHYAHQNLVVHRDLKPGNILVTASGAPKLLDFGIAKLLEADADATLTSMRLMTPECASPEQVRGESITTAADIYSLGILLYQLLAGEPPYCFPTRSAEEIRRIVCETEPGKPSTHRPVPADLDNIVLKAMCKEPGRRYASAEQLAEDIERYLAGMPVRARRDTLRYRASKFLARNKATSVAAGLLVLSVLGGMAATLWETHVSAAARGLAERRFKDVRSLAASNLFELNDALEKLPASAAARHLLIQRALEYLDRLRSENGDDRDLMREIALGYERIAYLQGRFTGKGVGDVKSSVASYGKALALRSALVEMSHYAPDEVKSEVRLMAAYTLSLLISDQLAGALQSAQTALALSLQLVKNQPQDQEANLACANAHLVLAWALGGNGSSPSSREFGEAIAHDQAAIELLEPLISSSPSIRQRAAFARLNLAVHYWKCRAFDKSLQILDGIVSSETAPSLPLQLVLRAYNWRGNTFARLGDHRKALRDYRQGLLLASSLTNANPDDMDARLNWEILKGLAAIEEARLGGPRIGFRSLNEAITSVQQMFGSNPELFYQRILDVGYSFRGEILSSLGDQPAARADLARCRSIAEDLAKFDPTDLESPLQIARVHAAMGVLWARSDRIADARGELSTAVTLAKQLLARRPEDGEALDLARTAENDLVALARCPDEKGCRLARQLQLPSLLD